MSGDNGKGFMNEVVLELDIGVWRGPEGILGLRDSQRSAMKENGLREGSISAGFKSLQEVEKRETVGAMGPLHLSPSCYSPVQWPLATCGAGNVAGLSRDAPEKDNTRRFQRLVWRGKKK